MTITELQQQYAAHPNTAVMERLLKDASVQTIFCGGLCASSASLFSSVLVKQDVCPFVFVLGDLEEAGYFYHDLTQVLGTEKVLFFPSSFRRSIKYGQKDAANAVLIFVRRKQNWLPRFMQPIRRVPLSIHPLR